MSLAAERLNKKRNAAFTSLESFDDFLIKGEKRFVVVWIRPPIW